jgi:hypothetical protein
MVKSLDEFEAIITERDMHIRDMYTHASTNNKQQGAISNKLAQDAKAKLISAYKELRGENEKLKKNTESLKLLSSRKAAKLVGYKTDSAIRKLKLEGKITSEPCPCGHGQLYSKKELQDFMRTKK